MLPHQLESLDDRYVLIARPRPGMEAGLTANGPSLVGDASARRRGALDADETANDTQEEKKEPVRLLMHRSLRTAGRARKPIQAYLSYFTTASGAANTAFAFNLAVRPNLDSSFASWQGVFDEMKVLSAEAHWLVTFTVLPTAIAAQPPNAVMVYEPSDLTALASVNAGLQYEHCQLLSIAGNAAGTYAVSPQATAKGGYMVFKAKVPSGPQISVTDTLASAGLWRPTADAQNYYWGLFQGYVAQGGVTSVLQVSAFVRMRVEFRTRR